MAVDCMNQSEVQDLEVWKVELATTAESLYSGRVTQTTWHNQVVNEKCIEGGGQIL